MTTSDFATLPDDYVFRTGDDGAMVAALAQYGGVVSYSTNEIGQLIAPITAFGQLVGTADELRALLRSNPRPAEPELANPFQPIGNAFERIRLVLAWQRASLVALRKVLIEEGLFMHREIEEALQTEANEALWPYIDELTIDWIPANQEAFKRAYREFADRPQRLNVDMPPMPSQRKQLYDDVEANRDQDAAAKDSPESN